MRARFRHCEQRRLRSERMRVLEAQHIDGSLVAATDHTAGRRRPDEMIDLGILEEDMGVAQIDRPHLGDLPSRSPNATVAAW